MAVNMFSAGVYENIVDDSFIPEGDGVKSAGIVITSEKGPTELTHVRSANTFAALFGLPTRDNPSKYAALRFLNVGQSLYVRRVINDAVAASGDLMDGVDTVASFTAANEGVWGNDITIQFADVIGVEANSGIFAVIVLYNDEQVERFEVSRDPEALDGNGRNMFIDEVINNQSNYIRVTDEASYVGDYVSLAADVDLTGGLDDTVAPDSTQIATAWDDFASNEVVDSQILINAGFASIGTQVKMIEIAEGRSNTVAILDVPQVDADDATAMVAWRNDSLEMSSNRAALYGGWLRVYDPYSNREVEVPPSGDVAAAIVEIFGAGTPWEAVAGIQNGNLSALGVTKIFSQEERDELYLNGVNPITSIGGSNAVIWGNKTLQKERSALDRLNVVNNVLWMTDRMKKFLDPFVFRPNNQFIRDNINYILTTFLEGVQTQGGLYAYRVDTESKNTPAVIDANQLIVDVFVQPVKTAEFIRLNVTVTPTGVDLEAI